MPQSVLDAIKMGIWDYEPEDQAELEYESTEALPGTDAKLAALSARIERGLPLWHPGDRRTYNDSEQIPE